MELYNLDKYLEEITINTSIRGLGDLYQKYRDEAKNVDLGDQFSDYSKSNKFFVSVRIELPSHSSNSSDACYFVLNGASTGVSISKNIEIENTIVNNDVNKNRYERVLRGLEQIPCRLLGTITTQQKAKLNEILPSFYYRRTVKEGGEKQDDVELLGEKELTESEKERIKKLMKKLYVDISGIVYGEFNDLFFFLYATDPYYDNKNKKHLTYILVVSDTEDIFKDKSGYELKEEIRNKIYEISAQIRNRHTKNLDVLFKRESIKSVIAAIMSRNMSHNLGSHLLTNTKNYFKQRVDEVEQDTVNKELIGADYRGNVILLQYLQERMDFISTVVSGEHYPFGSLNVESQLYDVLTSDEQGPRQGKPTKNFLLDYIVYSEKLTRLQQKDDPQQQFHNLVMQLSYNDGKREIVFKGKREDKEGKYILSKVRMAAPGGLMARHAFFSIIENILRNSAKHHRNDKDLTLSIKLVKKNEGQMEVSIFDTDNPAANTVISKFRELKILNVDNSLDKYNKGLKEILICVLWLQNKDVSDWLYENVQKKEGYDVSEKEALLRVSDENGGLCYTFDVPIFEPKHELKEGREYKSIIHNNENVIELFNRNLRQIHADIIIADENFKVNKKDVEYGEYKRLNEIFPRFLVKSKLGLNGVDDLRIFVKDHFKEYFEEKITLEHQLRGNNLELLWLFWELHPEYFHEIICINGTFSNGRKTENGNMEEKTTIEQNGKVVVKKLQKGDEDWRIQFYDHFHSKTLQEKISILKKSEDKLMESISGENYTSTIATYDFLNDPELRYKTVEALETKIVIIDERIFGDMRKRQLDLVWESVEIAPTPKWWQDCQNESDLESKLKKRDSSNYMKNKAEIQKTLQSENDFLSKKEFLQRLLYAPKEESIEYSKLSKEDKEYAEHIEQTVLERRNIYLSDFQKDFADYKFKNLSGGEQVEIKKVDFLTIHLGIIEKFVTWYCTTRTTQIVDRKMALNECFRRIKEKFHPKYISIHSGRGNFSPELQEDLKSYPFISLSALEAAFYNCKFFLSELFYNMNYYGKGNFDH